MANGSTSPAAPPADPNAASSRTGVAAIVTYILLVQFFSAGAAVITMIATGVKADAVLLALLSGMVGSLTTMVIGAVGFWIGSSVGAKASGDALMERSKRQGEALEQLAGAGPPPPAEPRQ